MSTFNVTIDEIDSSCLDLLRKAYDAFNARDVEAALSCMDADIDWPNVVEGGYMYGHKAVHDYWIRQWHMMDPQIDPVGYGKDEEGNIVVEVHQVVRDLEGNIILEETIYHVYLILQGVIKHMEMRRPKTPEAAEAPDALATERAA